MQFDAIDSYNGYFRFAAVEKRDKMCLLAHAEPARNVSKDVYYTIETARIPRTT